MNVLVLGGTGFIGRPLVHALADLGHDVGVFHRGRTTNQVEGCVPLLGDRNSEADLRRALSRFAPDVVVDLLARTQAEAELAVEAMRHRPAHAIVISSIDVYEAYERLGGHGNTVSQLPLGEDAPLRTTRFPRRRPGESQPAWEHDYDKTLVEKVYQAAHQPWTILRLPFVYGPGDYRKRLSPYAEAVARGARRILIPHDKADWRCTRGFVSDMARAIAATVECEAARQKVFNVGEPDALTELAWARAIVDVAGWHGEVAVDQARNGRCAWQQSLVVDTRRIRRIVGYQEGRSTREALAETWRALVRTAP